MASMVATHSPLPRTSPSPRLTFKPSNLPNPSFLKTSPLPQTLGFSLKVGAPRVLPAVVPRASLRPTTKTVPAGGGAKVESLLKFNQLWKLWLELCDFKDPNSGMEEKRWKLIKDRIVSKGGVVTAEDLAPFLDVLDDSPQHEEAYMFPVLVRFQGRPVVDECGHVFYHFESLYGNFVRNDGKFFEEKKWALWSVEDLCWILVDIVALGLVWLVGDWVYDVLSGSLGHFVRFFTSRIPLLSMFHLFLILIVAVKCFKFVFCCIFPNIKNAGVRKRNQARQQAALALQSPSDNLKRKLERARAKAQTLRRQEGGDQCLKIRAALLRNHSIEES